MKRFCILLSSMLLLLVGCEQRDTTGTGGQGGTGSGDTNGMQRGTGSGGSR